MLAVKAIIPLFLYATMHLFISRSKANSKLVPSLLYSQSEASSLDAAAIFAVGSKGFNELVKLDARFKRFHQVMLAKIDFC